MRSDDPFSNNLLVRLFSYTPRVGRQALEDYCTETLAWCLPHSRDLLHAFCISAGVRAVPDFLETLEIDTQMPFEGIDANSPEEDKTGGRFDLVIQWVHLPRPY